MNKGFESSPFDLVFLDINMPDCDGINYAVSVKNSYHQKKKESSTPSK